MGVLYHDEPGAGGLAPRLVLGYSEAVVNAHRTAKLAVLAVVAALLAACDEPATASPTDASAPPPSASAPAPPRPSASASASAAPVKKVLQILKLTFTSEVKNKEPADKLEAAEPGQRVYVHLAMRNRNDGSRKITVVFNVNKEQRSKTELNVESSWSYRTWAYVTLRQEDRAGAVEVEIRDEDGGVIGSSVLPIKAASAKPLPHKK
jgi:hypothetical protein